ncbi:pyridoxal kinase PdxY [Acidisoma cellulosilytica]|uniref:pyridoxal kinase n=1 Tax=Acidisoma cellulosilyticum TaxID=2802395 RepID=A0A963YYH6_9PROT|nr:pyridoxal kinase PdxY [Acidisoma cellulosilyticum]MCB8879310.1 pyridoxal kinase PdxY [Acidisoma cellulosilyticum]
MNILSIQSWVSYGHVGNAAAVFPMQRLGAEVWAINTVQFSNHTGYGSWRGSVLPPDLIREVVTGIEERGALPRCDALLSGYLGDPQVAEAVLYARARLQAANPRAIYCADPVIGDDDTGVYVRPGIAELMRDQIVPAADILTPNLFELRHLTGLPCDTLAGVKDAVAALQARGPRRVLVTSLRTPETPDDQLDMLAAEGGDYHRLRAPLLPLSVNGAGDAVAALFLVHTLQGKSAADALSAAGSAIFGILRRTAELGQREIALIAAQQELVSPSTVLRPVSV